MPAAGQLAALGKQFAVKAVPQLAMSIPTVVRMSGGVDAVTQLVQLAQGRSRHWDDKLSFTALIGAAIGVTLGPVARQAGQLLGERLQSLVSTRVADVTPCRRPEVPPPSRVRPRRRRLARVTRPGSVISWAIV